MWLASTSASRRGREVARQLVDVVAALHLVVLVDVAGGAHHRAGDEEVARAAAGAGGGNVADWRATYGRAGRLGAERRARRLVVDHLARRHRGVGVRDRRGRRAARRGRWRARRPAWWRAASRRRRRRPGCSARRTAAARRRRRGRRVQAAAAARSPPCPPGAVSEVGCSSGAAAGGRRGAWGWRGGRRARLAGRGLAGVDRILRPRHRHRRMRLRVFGGDRVLRRRAGRQAPARQRRNGRPHQQLTHRRILASLHGTSRWFALNHPLSLRTTRAIRVRPPERQGSTLEFARHTLEQRDEPDLA